MVPVADPVEYDESDKLSSIAKAVRVLRALATVGDGEAGVTDLAEQAELPKSTTHRVLSALIGEGLVGRSGQRYRLGPGWFMLQSALSSSEWAQLVDQSSKPLADLFERTGATVHLGVLDGQDVLYLEKLTARGGTSVPTRVGARMPATCTALGKCLLAFADDDVVRSVVSNPLPMASQRSIGLPRLLLHQFDEIQRTGLAFDVEESQPGVLCVAAPIFQGGQAVAAISVTRVAVRGLSPTDGQDVERTARQVAGWLTGAYYAGPARVAGALGAAFRSGDLSRPSPGSISGRWQRSRAS